MVITRGQVKVNEICTCREVVQSANMWVGCIFHIFMESICTLSMQTMGKE